MSFVALLALIAPVLPQAESRPESRIVAFLPEGATVQADSLRFAANGTKVAYVALIDGTAHAVIGGTVGDGYDTIWPPVIDARAEHVAFRAAKVAASGKPSYTVLLDGRKLVSDAWIGPVSLSPTDGTPAFWQANSWITEEAGEKVPGPGVLVVGKKKSSKWQSSDDVLAPVFSADGRFVYSTGTKDEGWAVLIFDTKGKETNQTGYHIVEAWPQPGGTEIVYTMQDAARDTEGDDDPLHYVVVRGVPNDKTKDASPKIFGAAYDSAGGAVFSPDGLHVAYRVVSGGKMGVAIDAEADAKCPYDFVDELAYDPFGKQLTYVAVTGCKVAASEGAQVLVDVARADGGKWIVVQGTVTSGEFDETKLPRWSPNGKQLAFAAREDETWTVRVGEKASDAFDAIGAISWAPDGKSVWFGALRGREFWWSVLPLE
ncbi:MAG: hypothetical protein K8S98_14415 [Planctomycetes bacterium]|nr:hypothetical protein [Planctomycetota bacterium]